MSDPLLTTGIRTTRIYKILRLAGVQYWSASILPAIFGTLLPFWLRPPKFSFNAIAAVEFIAAAVLVHAGFSFFLGSGKKDIPINWARSIIMLYGLLCILIACMLGFHINSLIPFHSGVPKYIFIAFGIAVMINGIIYTLPPASLYRRIGGEVVIAEGLGMIPVLGAYLAQVGDITRTVYIASLPMVAATGLWIWVDELAGRDKDEEAGRRTLVMDFGVRFSGRYGVLLIIMALFTTLIAAIISSSVNPVAVFTLLIIVLAWKIIAISWKGYSSSNQMILARNYAILLHSITGSFLSLISLITPMQSLF